MLTMDYTGKKLIMNNSIEQIKDTHDTFPAIILKRCQGFFKVYLFAF